MTATGAARHLSVDEVRAIYERLNQRFGGDGVLRDTGLLESALFRPRTGHYPDLVGMAAALLESLLMSRPFSAGNQRLAVFAVDVFLRLNGWQLRVDARDTQRHLADLDLRRSADFAHLEPWLRRAAVPLVR